jgi:hypothetical protein
MLLAGCQNIFGPPVEKQTGLQITIGGLAAQRALLPDAPSFDSFDIHFIPMDGQACPFQYNNFCRKLHTHR